jgi:metal-responsive CopG/Arc/MetJ family transcriptional regulator
MLMDMTRIERVKTSVTLPRDLLAEIDVLPEPYKSRSELIEAALRAFVAQACRRAQDARDVDIINRNADALNAEALDVLDYQVGL